MATKGQKTQKHKDSLELDEYVIRRGGFVSIGLSVIAFLAVLLANDLLIRDGIPTDMFYGIVVSALVFIATTVAALFLARTSFYYAIRRRPFLSPLEASKGVSSLAEALEPIPDKSLVGKVIREFTIAEIRNITKAGGPGYAKFDKEQLEKITSSIIAVVEPGWKAYATAFTKLDQFWCFPGHGSNYLKFNLELREKGVDLIRVFGVDSEAKLQGDARRQELFRLLQATGPELADKGRCDLYYVLRSDLPESKHHDFFIITDANNDPKISMSWDLSGDDGDLLSISIGYRKDVNAMGLLQEFLGSLDDYVPGAGIAVPIDTELTGPPPKGRSIASLCSSWEHLNGRSRSGNQAEYLRSPVNSLESGDLSAHWTRLFDSLIRPTRESFQCLADHCQDFVDSQQFQKGASALSLGCTPETRLWMQRNFAGRTSVMDLSAQMFHGMNFFIQDASPEQLRIDDSDMEKSDLSTLRQQTTMQNLMPGNWIDLKYNSNRYDLIVGVDVLNMMSATQQPELIDAIINSLNPGGAAFLHTIVRPSETGTGAVLRSKLAEIRQDRSFAARYLKARDLDADIGQAFSMLCLAGPDAESATRETSNISWSIDTGHIVDLCAQVEEVLTARQDPLAEQEHISERYRYVNSQIRVPTEDALKSSFYKKANNAAAPFEPEFFTPPGDGFNPAIRIVRVTRRT